MRTFTLILALLVGLAAGATRTASAEQFYNNGHVVHTRVAPVVVHRIFPPYRGVHVHQGRTIRR